MKPLLSLVALLAVTVAAAAADLSGRVVNSSQKYPTPETKAADRWPNAFIQTREIEISTSLTKAELAAGAVVEVAIIDPAPKPEFIKPYGETKTITLATTIGRDRVAFTYEAAPSRKDAWTARLLIGGKPVAWAAGNDKALAWLKAKEAKP